MEGQAPVKKWCVPNRFRVGEAVILRKGGRARRCSAPVSGCFSAGDP